MDDLITDFLIEADEIFAELEPALAKLRNDPKDEEALNTVFRNIHTIKGSCGFLGFSRLEEVSHHTEQLLVRLRDDADYDVTEDALTLICDSVERIKLIVHDLKENGKETSGNDTALIEKLDDTAPDTPTHALWATLPLIVDDVASRSGKKIEFEIQGQDTNIEPAVMRALKAPLVQIIRNAAHHGIETPETREALSKDKTGKILVTARHKDGHLIIEIIDDGAGLQTDRIKAHALEMGLTKEEELGNMSIEQINNFIFEPGFSTAQDVTVISGRGVGMDVVRNNIEKILGILTIQTVEGRGSTFTIKIPIA